MLPRATKAAIVAALACSVGLHWAFFQSLAWVGMVITYSQNAPLREALTKTFDGKHPCLLCKQIAQGRQSEKKSEPRSEIKKFEFSHTLTTFSFARPSHFWMVRPTGASGQGLTQQPPAPPPKFSFA